MMQVWPVVAALARGMHGGHHHLVSHRHPQVSSTLPLQEVVP